MLTYSQHENAEARDWAKARRQGDHPIVYVAPLSHACYFEPGAHPYVLGVDNPGTPDPQLVAKIQAAEQLPLDSKQRTAASESSRSPE